jgi:AraC-like DNA-binding protein
MPRLSEPEYAAFYGVVPRWDRPECKLVFSKADLARPFRGASPELAKLLSDNVGRLLAPEATRASFEDELERAFWTAHQRGEATLETTAEVLGLTARTLQRRLGAKGTSFADERGKLLVRRATELLRDESLPVESVAERLGYTSRAAFERAFQRWTGKTPSAARRT